MLLALWWGGGANYLLNLVDNWTQRRIWQHPALLIILLLPIGSLLLNWSAVDLSDDWQAHAYTYQALQGVEPNSLIIVRGDRPTFALWYGAFAEGLRDDVAIVNGPMLAFIWYRDHLRHLYPHLSVPQPVAEKVTTDDLVRELIIQNSSKMPIYATDPNEPWKTWFEFEEQDAPIYQVAPKTLWEQDR
jgi:hypothetical protein